MRGLCYGNVAGWVPVIHRYCIKTATSTRISRSRHFLKLNIGKTVHLKDKVTIAQEEPRAWDAELTASTKRQQEILSSRLGNIWNDTMFGDLDWPLNASHRFVSIIWDSHWRSLESATMCFWQSYLQIHIVPNRTKLRMKNMRIEPTNFLCLQRTRNWTEPLYLVEAKQNWTTVGHSVLCYSMRRSICSFAYIVALYRWFMWCHLPGSLFYETCISCWWCQCLAKAAQLLQKVSLYGWAR